MKKIMILLGSTRNARNGSKVFQWVADEIKQLNISDIKFEFVDLLEINLPFYDFAVPPSFGKYSDKKQIAWAKKVKNADGFIIITPEYNHGYPAPLKNALDYLFAEWHYKPVAFIGYGGASGGIRAIEQLKQVVLELKMIPLREEVSIPFVWEAFDENGKPINKHFMSKLKVTILDLVKFVQTVNTSKLIRS